MAQLNFDATAVTPSTGVAEAVPAGWYNVAMDESSMKPTKNADGFYLEARFNILDGQYVGRKLFIRLNVRNANPIAQEIAYKDLSAICHATGVLQVADSTQLHGRPLKVKVKVRKATDEYEASNDITAYKNINEQVDMGSGISGGNGVPQGFGTPAPQAPVQQAPMQQQPQQQWQPPAATQQWAAPVYTPAQAPAEAAPQWQAPAQTQQPMQPQAQPQAQPVPPQASQPQAGFPGAVPPWMQGQQPTA
jgi:hypothetical protein